MTDQISWSTHFLVVPPVRRCRAMSGVSRTCAEAVPTARAIRAATMATAREIASGLGAAP